MTLREQYEREYRPITNGFEAVMYTRWLEKRIAELEKVAKLVKDAPQRSQEMFRRENIVFKTNLVTVQKPTDEGWWERVAFTLYTQICVLSWNAENVLPKEEPKP